MSAPARLAYLVVDAVDLIPWQALDRASLEVRVAVTLGRHANDWTTSFYMATPERLADGPSLWGHERSWLAQPLRERARALRLQASEKGLKAPLPNQV